MKKRFLALIIGACTLIGAVISGASAVSQTNTLISKSYLETVYLQEVQTLVSGQVTAAFSGTYNTALQSLNTIAEGYIKKLAVADDGESDWLTAGSLVAQSGVAGDTITLKAGASLVWRSGTASFSGTLIDTTAGQEVANGKLTVNHRYVAAENSVITVSGESAYWSVEGEWLTTGKDAEDEPPEVQPEEPAVTFSDVPEGAWYYDAVYYAVNRGLFNGTSDTTFAPTQTMTRGMLTTVLYRMSESPNVDYSPIFSDVPDGQWYSTGTVWAGSNGIVNGVGNGLFNPTGELTREQIAQMLYNYATWLGLDTSARGDLTAFSDASSIGSWAKDAVSWAVEIGLMQGSAGQLMPKKAASRAEVAALLQRFDIWMFV